MDLKRLWGSAGFSLCFFSLLSILTHLWAINTPPTGVHTWRQCGTAAVARNFYEEGMNIFQPRIDARGSGEGWVGMEFPLVNWLVAWTYHLFGFQHWSGRVVVLLFSLLSNAYFFLIARKFVSLRSAYLATLIYIFGPLYFYYSRNLMPEVPALAMALGSLYFYLTWEENPTHKHAFLCLVHLGLTGLIKIPYLSVSILLLALLVRSPQWRAGAWKKSVWYSVLALLPAFSWWIYSDRMNSQTDLVIFDMMPRISLEPKIILDAAHKVLVSGVPEYMLSYPMFVFFLVFIVIYGILKRATWPVKIWFLWSLWLFAAGVHLFLHIKTLRVHNYYWLPLAPPVALVSGVGLDYALTHWRSMVSRVLLVLTLLSAPYFYGYRFSRNLEPSEYRDLAAICDRLLPPQSLIVVAPDPSPHIMLYYAHRKGWSFPERVTQEELVQAVDMGADYLVSSRLSFQQRPDVQQAFPVVLYQDGGLAVLATPQGARKNATAFSHASN